MNSQLSLWIGFHIFVFAMLALDLGVFHKREREISVKESLLWTGLWIGLALIFNYGVYHYMGSDHADEFLTAYVLEKSLSVDNIFVMSLIFSYFKVPPQYQHRVLFWGILGALCMRVLFIVGGVALINQFHFILYFFGAFLIYTGLKMLRSGGEVDVNPEESFIYRFCKKYFRMTDSFSGQKFFVQENGHTFMTPLFLVLLIIESSDVIFAVDSIPATLSVTKSSFIAYTSNIFAVLGLRSLYFAFAGVVKLFRFLSYALSVVLVFIGVKMLIEYKYKIPTSYSLGVVLGVIAFSILVSFIVPEEKEKTPKS